MDHVRTLVPPAARRWIYAIYILAGLFVGAVTVATGGLDWTAAERVLAYLAVPLAVLAGVNVPTGGDWIDSQADDRYPDLLDDLDDEDDPYFVSEELLREIDRQRE